MTEKADLIVFDLDGTLVDSQLDLAIAVNHVRDLYGRSELDLATVREYVGSGVKTLIERALPGVTGEALATAVHEFRRFYAEHILDNTRPYPGIRDLLEGLDPVRKAVLTNKPEAHTCDVLDGLGLRKYFVAVSGGDSPRGKKPSPHPLLHIIRSVGVSPVDTIMVGDGINDVLAAKAAGVRCVAVDYGYSPREELVRLQPDHLLSDVRQLAQLLMRV